MPTRILIAEDDPFSLKLLKMILKSTGEYEVVTAVDGEQAWKVIEAGPAFDLCIFDIMMPGLDGLQLTNRLRADPRFRDQKVMLCTALNDRHTIDQASALAISYYVVKPYSRDNVLKQIRRICGAQIATAQLEPAAQVAARLGVEAGQVSDFLQDLQLEVGQLIALLRANPAWPEGSSPAIRVNALKGAAINLGARSLAMQLAALELRLTSKPPAPDSHQAVEGVEMENELLRRALEPDAPLSGKEA
jgi:two-component system chemotaxis response regulator CheY